jgi:hypothetical protein
MHNEYDGTVRMISSECLSGIQKAPTMPGDICLVGGSTEEIADLGVVAIGSNSCVLELVSEKIWPKTESFRVPCLQRNFGSGVEKSQDWARILFCRAIRSSPLRVALQSVNEDNTLSYIQLVASWYENMKKKYKW